MIKIYYDNGEVYSYNEKAGDGLYPMLSYMALCYANRIELCDDNGELIKVIKDRWERAGND